MIVQTPDTTDKVGSDSISKDIFSVEQCEKLTRMIQNSMKTMTTWNTTSHLSGKSYSIS